MVQLDSFSLKPAVAEKIKNSVRDAKRKATNKLRRDSPKEARFLMPKWEPDTVERCAKTGHIIVVCLRKGVHGPSSSGLQRLAPDLRLEMVFTHTKGWMKHHKFTYIND